MVFYNKSVFLKVNLEKHSIFHIPHGIFKALNIILKVEISESQD